VEAWDEVELEDFLRSIHRDRHAAAWFLAGLGGLRRGEILALRWRNVHVEDSTVTIVEGLSRTSVGLDFTMPKTDRGKRTIKVSPRVVAELRDAKVRQANRNCGSDLSTRTRG